MKVIIILQAIGICCMASSVQMKLCISSELVPGMMMATSGIDITQLDYFAKSKKAIMTISAFRNSIHELTCNYSQHWTNPYLPSSNYEVPDGVADISIDPAGQFSSSVTVSSHAEQMKEFLHANGNISINGTYSFGGGYTGETSVYETDNYTVVDIKTTISAYTIDLFPYTSLQTSKDFALLTENMTNSFETNPAPYNVLIAKYGTHFLTSTKVGGLLLFRMYIENSYMTSNTSNTEIYDSIGASYADLIGVEVGANVTNNESHSVFNQHSHMESYFYGGNVRKLMDNANEGPLSEKQFNKWIRDVQKHPHLLSALYTPISYLLYKNETIQKQMEIAAKVYLVKDYLRKAKSIISSLGGNGAIEDKIRRYLQQVVPADSDIEQLRQEMSAFVDLKMPTKENNRKLDTGILRNKLQHIFMQKMQSIQNHTVSPSTKLPKIQARGANLILSDIDLHF